MKAMTPFKRREPKARIGGFVDTTHLRFVDVATLKQLRDEYQLIKQKKSKLSRKQRDIITQMFAQ